MGYVRADLLAAKPYNIKKLVESGFTSMHFGIETFNDHAGQIIGKGLPSVKLKETLIKLKQDYPQVYTNGTFIIGLPGETSDNIKDTANWIIESKAIDFWTFNPLAIPKKNKLIYSSEFTDNYLMYGYSKLTADEIAQEEIENSDFIFSSKILPYVILWKNNFFNYYTAAKLAHEINQRANPYKKVDAWTSFAISSLGLELEQIQKYTYDGENPLDQVYVNNLSNKFIETYKKNKIDYFNQLTK
jgi:radical SAM superfamily enzyme YgiQ (UPF0313 family)